MLVMDLERWLDHVISEYPDIRGQLKGKSLSRATMGDKLLLIVSAGKIRGLSEATNNLVKTRNEAAHGRLFSQPDRQYIGEFLQNAELVVGTLAALRQKPQSTQQDKSSVRGKPRR